MTVIGLTGPTGAGKTTALRVLEDMGFTAVDCDALYYELLKTDGELRRQLLDTFGNVFLPDGQLDRPTLGRLVFGNKKALDKLNAIVFPAVTAAVREKISACSGRGLVIDAINLIESGLGELCDCTIAVTALCTVISAIVSFFLALAASENLSSSAASNVVKGIVAIIRSIPTILWVLVFTVAIGLGSEAAVLGISFHSIAYLTKSYSESFEEIDEGVIEALRASGASFWQIVFQAIVPATITKLLSWTFIRLEINFTNAVAVGAFAGAGGIGFQLYQAGSRYYNLHEVGVIVYACLIAAFVLEYVSVQLRRRYILQD